MKSSKEEILNKLNEIDFHDMPVERISFETERSTDFIVDIAWYQEDKKDYDYWSLKFLGIERLNADKLSLVSDSELEINSFDYELNDGFDCSLLFLTGFGRDSFKVELRCLAIELIESSR